MEVEKIDRRGMKNLLDRFPQQCQEAVRIGETIEIPSLSEPRNIVILGMGGSAIGGEILRDLFYSHLPCPIQVLRDYKLPPWVDKSTFLVAISYSGNTEETLYSLREGIRRKCSILSLSSGGELAKLSVQEGIPHISIPEGMPPRTALGYLLLPLVVILTKLQLVEKPEFEETIKVLENLKEHYTLSSPSSPPCLLAEEIRGKIPLIWGVEGVTGGVAHRWKTQFNENSKILAFWDIFPELNHNEVVPWGGEGEVNLKNFFVVLLRSPAEHPRIRRRIELTREMIEEKCGGIKEIWPQGKTPLSWLLSLVYMGDWTSFYLALLQGVDPTQIKPIEWLKKELSKF